MEFNDDLFNAAMIAENPEEGFIVAGHRLHAVEPHVAELMQDKSNPEMVLPLMRSALAALVKFAEGKVSAEAVSLKPKERDQLIQKIEQIYMHLPHHERMTLSSMIHHKQVT